MTYRCNLDASLALLPAGDAFFNSFLHSYGPLVMLHLMYLDARTFSASKILLEILHLRSSAMRVSELDDCAGVQKVLDNAAECTPPKLEALATEDLLHLTIDAKPDWTEFLGTGPIDEGCTRCLQGGRVRN